MSNLDLPPGYQIEQHTAHTWYAWKTEHGLSQILLNERRETKVFRSEESAAAYCRGHARHLLDADQAVQQKGGAA